MNIAVMGAGAVGCYYGAMLAAAGHQVILIGRPSFVEAVTVNGLILEKEGTRSSVQVEASSDPSAVSSARVVLICVKSGDTEQAGRDVAPHLHPAARVLSLQNGISNAETLKLILGRQVMPVVVYVASRIIEPGIVRHEGHGNLELSGQGANDIAAMLNAAGIETRVSEDVLTSLWTKLVINCAINPLSALTQSPYGTLAAIEGILPLMEDIAREAIAVAQAEGIFVPTSVLETIRTIPITMSGQYSSTAQDLALGKPTEIELLNGEVVKRASRLGIAVPINRTLTLLVKCAERKTTDSY